MARQTDSAAAEQLHQVRSRIKVWRWTHPKYSRMPAELWAKAVGLARRLGVWTVAHDLGVSYGSLKRRVDEDATGRGGRGEGSGGFVEVDGMDLLGGTVGNGSVVEILDIDGARMTIRLPVDSQIDATALVGAFRRREA